MKSPKQRIRIRLSLPRLLLLSFTFPFCPSYLLACITPVIIIHSLNVVSMLPPSCPTTNNFVSLPSSLHLNPGPNGGCGPLLPFLLPITTLILPLSPLLFSSYPLLQELNHQKGLVVLDDVPTNT